MGKVNTAIIKPSFSKKNTANYKLSILCGVDSLCYCISNELEEVLVLKRIDLSLSAYASLEAVFSNSAAAYKEIWDTDPHLHLDFSTISIAFIHPHFSLVPNRLYQEVDKPSYLAPLKKEALASELYFANELEGLAAKLVFSLPKSAIDFLGLKYQHKVTYYNSLTSLIKQFSTKMQLLSGKHIWINVHPTILQIVLFDGRELIFSNQFSFQSEKDFLYYILLVYNQFKLNPEVIPLHIAGQLFKESTVYQNLYRYIRNISFVKISDKYQLDAQLTENPTYFFFDVLSI